MQGVWLQNGQGVGFWARSSAWLGSAALWLGSALMDSGVPALLGLKSGLCEAGRHSVHIRMRARAATRQERDPVPGGYSSEPSK